MNYENDEQGERIATEWAHAQKRMAQGDYLDYFEFEDIFEDRDPFEFL